MKNTYQYAVSLVYNDSDNFKVFTVIQYAATENDACVKAHEQCLIDNDLQDWELFLDNAIEILQHDA